jgi:DNA-binding CsgD family transcriptional regulator
MHDGLETVFETFEVVWPPATVRRARLLAPRLEQGLVLLRRLEEARAAARDLTSVLARVETAVMTVGPDLRLRSANPAAEALLRRGDGLRLREGSLRVRRPRDEGALAAAVAAATCGAGVAAGRGGRGDALLAIGRDGDRPPYRLGVFALSDGQGAGRGRAADPSVLVLVDDPGRESVPARSEEDLFARAFGLTPAEARLAVRLAAGASLTEAAAALGVTRNTARAQLRAIFDKAEVHRQGELARLLHNTRSLRLSPR